MSNNTKTLLVVLIGCIIMIFTTRPNSDDYGSRKLDAAITYAEQQVGNGKTHDDEAPACGLYEIAGPTLKVEHACKYKYCPYKGECTLTHGCGYCDGNMDCWRLDSIHFVHGALDYDQCDSILSTMPPYLSPLPEELQPKYTRYVR